MKEFEKELAILKGRVDGLEARVGELEATQFSTTTKLKGQATFVIGANSYAGNATHGGADILGFHPNHDFAGLAARATKAGGLSSHKRADEAAALSGATTFNYDLRLFLDTSFTGKDLFRTMLRAGNFGDSEFGGAGYVGLNAMETAFGESGKANEVNVNRLWYQFPIGDGFTATVGGLVRQDDMLAVWPSAYPTDTVLDFFTYAGAPQTYNLTLGSGAGISWESNDFSVSANYVSNNGHISNPELGGIATNGAGSNGTVQVVYAPENWGLAAAYNYASGDNGAGIYAGNGTPSAVLMSTLGNTNSLGLSAWWTPEESGWVPSISAGYGYNSVSIDNAAFAGGTIGGATSQSWYVGLQWADAFLEGITLGMAVGLPTFVTSYDNDTTMIEEGSDFIADGNYAWEWWYAFQVTDNITVTPAIYYLSRPKGFTTGSAEDHNATFSNFGGLLKTTFKF
jgi:hypothetical protein